LMLARPVAAGSGNTCCVPASGSRIAAPGMGGKPRSSPYLGGEGTRPLGFGAGATWRRVAEEACQATRGTGRSGGPGPATPRPRLPRGDLMWRPRTVALLNAINLRVGRAHKMRGSGTGGRSRSHFPTLGSWL
jgi:hypothetical protein